MPQLLKNIESSEDLYLKHGSILAIGELSLGLSNEAQKTGKDLTEYFGEYCQINFYFKRTFILLKLKYLFVLGMCYA